MKLFHQAQIKSALNIAAISSNTTTVGTIIDTAGYEDVTIVVESGARTDGTYTPLLEEGDDSGLSDAAAVADGDLIGTEALAALTAAHKRGKLGYRGSKRYIRLSIVSTSVTTGATIGATAILNKARHANSTLETQVV